MAGSPAAICAADADRAECQRLAGIFCGNDPAYAPVRNWTGAPLAEHLRGRMEMELVPGEDDVSTVAQALAVLVHAIYGLLRDAGDEAAMQQTLAAAVRSMAMAQRETMASKVARSTGSVTMRRLSR